MEAEPEIQKKTREEGPTPSPLTTSFPQGKIKRIMKLDRDIKKATSEATFAISLASELFIQSLAARAHAEMTSRGRRIVRGEHVRSAVQTHQPTADFLLDCLSKPPPPASRRNSGATCQAEGEGRDNEKEKEKPLPRGTRRIDQFFKKTSVDPDTNQVETSVNPDASQVEISENPDANQVKISENPDANQVEISENPDANQVEISENPDANQVEISENQDTNQVEISVNPALNRVETSVNPDTNQVEQ